LPVIGITAGDPGGIGPEVVVKALMGFRAKGCEVRVIGATEGIEPGRLTKRSAGVALEALEESVRLLKAGEIQAVVNAPVSKENLARIGFSFPGQTEFYARAFGLKEEEVTMTMQAERLRVALVSTHCSLREAIGRLTPELIVLHAERVMGFLRRMGKRKGRLALAGVNPHAGEGGLFGDEERRVVGPAVRRLRRKYGAAVTGPVAGDTVFGRALQGEFDAVLCMYHDQGLIPFKLVAFAEGVNLTLGLPFWRSSPDHGTAVEIAGRNMASAASMAAALGLTARLVTGQKG